MLSPCVPTVLIYSSTGISTCCPSVTLFSLALGPDLPRADQLYSGNLGYSAWRIPTSISLLIPAFSLPYAPQLLPVLLRRICNAPLPITCVIPRLRWCVSAPDFSFFGFDSLSFFLNSIAPFLSNWFSPVRHQSSVAASTSLLNLHIR